MGKVISRGLAKLGEVGLSGGAIITGANLRRPPEKKSPEPRPKPSVKPAAKSKPEED